ncbi:Spy/CpxP family protein refolding chaperone [Halarcobacter ebronensis]|uniref:Periplasmic heavy metal sensor n=1 Tax=Halarcobacter ebronensis TaxID=1462615 RepID=A0A4Q1AM00_9BACT|nr:Spy/CpxP family protein refolding chaperone [Halarcobacter ebronensis]QKF81119.1 CpxP family two-component system-associated protein [Halarcobacter ebronensis]RXK06422.1 hypothetical protein CRV07_06945 [Halarcobacter ebronensis]
MKNKLLLSVALTGLLGTGLFAYGNGMPGMQNGGMPSPMGMCNAKMKMGKPFMGHGIISLLRELNLTPEQMNEIALLRQEMFKNRVKPSTAFTKNSFDEDKYLELMKQQRDNMLESRAKMVGKIYKILTPEQKEQLKVLMDLRDNRMPPISPMMNR